MFVNLIIIIWFAVIISMIQTFDVFVPNKPSGQKDSYFIKIHLRLNFYVDMFGLFTQTIYSKLKKSLIIE